jgi:hypothetical protein
MFGVLQGWLHNKHQTIRVLAIVGTHIRVPGHVLVFLSIEITKYMVVSILTLLGTDTKQHII